MALAKESGIYISVGLDSSELIQDMAKLRAQAGNAGEQISKAMGGSLAPAKLRKELVGLTTDLSKVTAAAKNLDVRVKLDGLDAVARNAGLASTQINGLYGAMVKTANNKAYEDALKNLQKHTGLSTAEMAKLRYQLGDTSGALKSFGAAALPVVGTVAAVGASALYMGKACFDAGLQLDRLNKSYTSIMGSSQGAVAQLDYIYGVTDKLSLQFQVTAESAKGFFASGEGTALEKDLNGIFEGVSTAASALSLSQDQVSRTFTALGQMISKGKVSAEELRQQFGEHIPGAMTLAAKAMGVSTAQLNKMMERGELMAEDLLPKLAQALKDKYAAGAIEAADGAQAAVNRMSTEWERFKASASNTELAVSGINAVTGALKYMSQEMGKNELDRKMREAGVLPGGVHTSGNGLRQEMIYTDAQRELYKQRQSAEQEALAATKNRQEASDRAAEKEAENLRIITDGVNKYTGALKETKLVKAETDYAAVANPLKEMLVSGKGDAEELKKQLALVDKAYADTLKKINEEGKKSAVSGGTHLNTYKAELDKTTASVSALKAQLEVPAGDVVTRDQIKIAKEYEQTIADIEKEAANYANKKGISHAQAEELKTQKLLEAQLKKTLALRDAENKSAEIRLDFEKRYADMVGATSEGVIASIRKQSAEYAAAGADRVRLAEWERDQIQRASHEAWDGAAVALRDYSAEAGNQAKGMNEAFSGLFSGMDSGFGNMWSQMIETGKVSLSSFRSLFANFLADLMHLAITRPITVSIAGAVSGALGLGNSAAQTGANGAALGLNMAGMFGGITNTINSSMAKWFPNTFSGPVSAGVTSGSLSTSAMQNASNLPPAGAFTGIASSTSFTGMLGGALKTAMPYAAVALIGKSIMDSVTAKMSNSNPIKRGWNVIDENSMQGGPGFFGWGDVADLLRKDRFSQASMAISPFGVLGGATTRSFNKFLGVSGGNGEKIGDVASMIIGDPLLGGALGALFGKGRKTKPSVYTLSNNMPISSDFDYTKAFTEGAWYDRAGQEEAQKIMPILGEAAKASAKQIETLVSALPDEFRSKVEADIAASAFSAGRGVPGMDKKNWNFQFYDEEQLKERLEAVVKDIQVAMGKTAQQAMANVDLTSMYTFDLTTSEGIGRAVQAVTSVKEITDATKEIAEPASALVAQAKAAKEQMKEWIAGMEEYGAGMDKVNAAVSEYQRVSIKAIIDELEASINPLSAYAQAVKDANVTVDDHKAAPWSSCPALGATCSPARTARRWARLNATRSAKRNWNAPMPRLLAAMPKLWPIWLT